MFFVFREENVVIAPPPPPESSSWDSERRLLLLEEEIEEEDDPIYFLLMGRMDGLRSFRRSFGLSGWTFGRSVRFPSRPIHRKG